jgi:recombination protein RecR
MPILPTQLEKLIEELGALPGVGPRTAERYAFYILRTPSTTASRLAEALTKLHTSVKYCPVTFMLISAEEDVSPLYSDSSRDKSSVVVVEEPFDVVAIEKTGAWRGVYHVLGGAISPIDGLGPDQLHIKELLKRLRTDKVKEVILATNASVEGESTALYVGQQIAKTFPRIKLSRLARGLPSGVDIEYADYLTLTRALENRQAL